MNKICTNMEQSKHLLELGLDPETADLVWVHDQEDLDFIIVKDDEEQFEYDWRIPAWSLSALLDLIPHTGFDGIELNNYNEGKTVWTAQFSYKAEISPMIIEDTPIDATYEIVCWLLKNGYIYQMRKAYDNDIRKEACADSRDYLS